MLSRLKSALWIIVSIQLYGCAVQFSCPKKITGNGDGYCGYRPNQESYTPQSPSSGEPQLGDPNRNKQSEPGSEPNPSSSGSGSSGSPILDVPAPTVPPAEPKEDPLIEAWCVPNDQQGSLAWDIRVYNHSSQRQLVASQAGSLPITRTVTRQDRSNSRTYTEGAFRLRIYSFSPISGTNSYAANMRYLIDGSENMTGLSCKIK